jgi:hypothetical protein
MKRLFDEVGVHYQDMSLAHQIRCPFHDDVHASARFYPGQNGGSGSFYCWACDMGGDVIWFFQQWFQEDSLLNALRMIEEMFDLKVSAEDHELNFYKARAKFEGDKSELTAKHVDLVEVTIAGQLRNSDPRPLRLRLFDGTVPRTPETYRLAVAVWKSFDNVVSEVAQLPYSDAVQRLQEWEAIQRQEISKWQERKVGELKPEQ